MHVKCTALQWLVQGRQISVRAKGKGECREIGSGMYLFVFEAIWTGWLGLVLFSQTAPPDPSLSTPPKIFLIEMETR